jgi:hypothetical protein
VVCFCGVVAAADRALRSIYRRGFGRYLGLLPSLHRFAPYDRAAVNVLSVATPTSFLLAVGASIALWLRWRLFAALAVIVVWSVLLIGSVAVSRLTRPGPELFDRYVLQERFLVPWQYAPAGEARPGAKGFSVTLCPTTLRGTYERDCGQVLPISLVVGSRDSSFEDSFEISFWRSRQAQMDRRDDEFGHEVYVQVDEAKSGRRITTFYARHDAKSRLIRFIRCFESSRSCRHHTLIGGYALIYDGREMNIENWEQNDRNLAELIDNWRASCVPGRCSGRN